MEGVSFSATTDNRRGIRLDPRTKLILLLTVTTLMFSTSNEGIMNFIKPVLSLIPFVLILSERRFKTAGKYLFLYLACFVLERIALTTLSGLLSFVVLAITSIMTRFAPGIMTGAYLLSSTSVSEFIGSMERMHLTEKIIIPMSVIFRFFPTISEEYQAIRDAMKMRGIRFGGKNPFLMVEYRLVPLMVSVVKIGDELSAAALTRGLGAPVKRTNVCQIGFHIQDMIAVLLCALCFALFLMGQYYCITSDQDSTFDFLSSLFLSFVFIRLVRYADEHCPGGELPVPVHVLGEELCACGVIPDLSRKISVIRSRNLSMSCVFQNLAGLQNRYPYNQWQEILGNCDVQLFLGCTDALTAEFISDRTGEASISVTSKAKQLGTWRVSNYTPEYRETSGVGRRKLMTMDEVLRMDVDKALIIIRGKNVLEVDKYDYSKHPEAKKLRPSKAASHVPAWRANQPQEKQTPSAPPSQAADKKPAQKKKPASAEKVVAVTKESIMKKKEDT